MTTKTEDADYEVNAEVQGEGDDESSLAEEESMESQEAIQDEVSALEREGDMPIEELLALYGYDDDGGAVVYESPSPSGSEIITKENAVIEEPSQERDFDASESSVVSDNRKSTTANTKSNLRKLFPLRSQSRGANENSEESSDDEDYVPLDDWKKEIHIGEDYQAVVPDRPDTVYNIPTETEGDVLLWDPSRLEPGQVKHFLQQSVWQLSEGVNGIEALPLGAPDGDNERALYCLHKCGYQVRWALELFPQQRESPLRALPAAWSEEDCTGFETGMRMFGKDFPSILERLPGRSLNELVEFYYFWKKTERHDHFVQQFQLGGRQDCAVPANLDGLEKYGDTDLESAFSSRAPSPGRGDSTSHVPDGLAFPRSVNVESTSEILQSAGAVTKGERTETLARADSAKAASPTSSLVVESGHSYARHERGNKRKSEEFFDMNKRKRGRVPVKIGSKHEDHTYNTADDIHDEGASRATENRSFSLPALPAPVRTDNSSDYLLAKEILPESSDDSFNDTKAM